MRRITTTLSVLALSLALGASAVAGGWAVTTLDEVPPDMRAGDTYQIGYTIRQHGERPVNVDEGGGTVIRITSPDGAKTLEFQGVREGPTGHYIAKVTFPYEGAWTWSVTQGPFAAQSLGPVKILPAVGAAAPAQPATVAAGAPAQQPATRNGFLITALLLATAGAAILFGTRVAAFAGRRASA